MKKLLIGLSLISLAFAIPPWGAPGMGYGGGPGMGYGAGPGMGPRMMAPGMRGRYFLYLINTFPSAPLSKEEIEGLKHMREEEKLARDVYLTLYKKWKLPIFNNIAGSEQIHMDAIKILLDRYRIPDPIAGHENDIGYFKSPEMRKLYKKLVEEGSKSIQDALKVGATVEDLDIKDLEDYLAKTDNTDIAFVYQNLMKGSRNHLRAFVYTLSYFGGTYKPKYISPEEFSMIISTPMERGPVGPDGRPMFWY